MSVDVHEPHAEVAGARPTPSRLEQVLVGLFFALLLFWGASFFWSLHFAVKRWPGQLALDAAHGIAALRVDAQQRYVNHPVELTATRIPFRLFSRVDPAFSWEGRYVIYRLWAFSLHVPVPFALAAILGISILHRRRLNTQRPPGSCRGCGYDLRALTRDRCPECGRVFDRSQRVYEPAARPRLHCSPKLWMCMLLCLALSHVVLLSGAVLDFHESRTQARQGITAEGSLLRADEYLTLGGGNPRRYERSIQPVAGGHDVIYSLSGTPVRVYHVSADGSVQPGSNATLRSYIVPPLPTSRPIDTAFFINEVSGEAP